MLGKQRDFRDSLKQARDDLQSLQDLDERLSALTGDRPPSNPYTWFTAKDLDGMWRDVQRLADERDAGLEKERVRQEANEKLRLRFANEANGFHKWLTETRFVLSIALFYDQKLTCTLRTCVNYWIFKMRN